MARFVQAEVVGILDARPGLQRVSVRRVGGEELERAFVLPELTGEVAVHDEVLMNTTAVDLELGTGGWHIVSTNLTRGAFDTPGDGHIMKLRYTPMQIDTGATEEHLDALPTDVDGAVVVACTVHSQVPMVVLGVRSVDPTRRIAYVMTDGASLPIAFSGLVHEMDTRGWLAAGTLTAGHAFGGHREVIGIPSALAVARHDAGADVIIVGMGPGVVGAGHPLANTALEAAPVLDTAAALGARPVCCVRASSGDARARHRGLSHHTATVLDLVRSPVEVPIPPGLTDALAPWRSRHHVIDVEHVDGAALLAAADLRVTTMGRGPDDDRLFFDAAAAAGVVAAREAG